MKTITVTLESTLMINNAGHCSNDCQHIQMLHDIGFQKFRAQCDLFDEIVTWDNRYKYNGYQRCPQCIAAEKRTPHR